jgi:hypothetical protein
MFQHPPCALRTRQWPEQFARRQVMRRLAENPRLAEGAAPWQPPV